MHDGSTPRYRSAPRDAPESTVRETSVWPMLPTYRGDQNALLKEAQLIHFGQNAVDMFRAAREALVFADRLLDTNLLVSQKARSIERIDSNALTDAQAILAAHYRYLHDNYGQLEFWPRFPIEMCYQVEWNRWFTETLDDLVTMPEFVRNTVDAVVFANSHYGEAAQHKLCLFLTIYCTMGDWGNTDGYLEKYQELPPSPVRPIDKPYFSRGPCP